MTEKVGQNEAILREVNERLEDMNDAFGTVSGSFTVVCECRNPECTEPIEIDRDEYEKVRADATLFVLVPGHEAPELESVVTRVPGYVVVEKHPGEPAEVAKATDPRA